MSIQLIEGEDFYYDSEHFMVLTEKYHLEKGFCCGHGCRHCPYEYENVPEPKKSDILTQQQLAKNVTSSNI